MSWYPRISTGKLFFFRHIPKVDLHRHLEGSIRIETLLELAEEHGIHVPEDEFHSLVQIQPNDPLTSSNFLSKFQLLRQFYRSPEIIQRITQEAIADAAADGVTYLELRFTPVALGRSQGFSAGEVMDWVARSAAEASQVYHIQTGLIASFNRHEPVALAEEVARMAADRIPQGIVGIDLAGNEAQFPGRPFAGIFREAQQSGLRLTVHAGEWSGAESVREAVEILGAERVGHGVRVVEDPYVMDLVRDRGTVLEVCVTSNYQSGVVTELASHPLARLVEAGLKVTINTDDPAISRITLSDEYRLALEELEFSTNNLAECILTAARSTFLSREASCALESRIRTQLTTNLNGWE